MIVLENTELAATGIDLDSLSDDVSDENFPISQNDHLENTRKSVVVDLKWDTWVQGIETSQDIIPTDIQDDRICKPFLSKVTLNLLRVTILSTTKLVDMLFTFDYKYVLTGKFNQDCIEVMITKIYLRLLL